ncbi:MAG: NADH:ubiquinone reductase (Na(+)-transporting) subunit A, partial [Pseudomonadota bacterium]
MRLIAKLTDGKSYVCHHADATLPKVDLQNVSYSAFSGPHPAGLVGTHIHFLEPAHAEKTVWHLSYQDVIAIGRLFASGQLPTERIIAVCGPAAPSPALLRTRLGAFIPDLIGEPSTGVRVISGDVLSGHTSTGSYGFLGRFHHQVTLIPEGNQREAFGWIIPSVRKFATANVHLSS